MDMNRHAICFSVITSLSVCGVSHAVGPAVGIGRDPLLKSIGACLASADPRNASIRAYIDELNQLARKARETGNSAVLQSYSERFAAIENTVCPNSAPTSQIRSFAAGKLRDRIDPRRSKALESEVSAEAELAKNAAATFYDALDNPGFVSGDLPAPAAVSDVPQETLEQEPVSYKPARFSEPPAVPFSVNPANQSIVDRLAHAAASVLGPQYENGIRLITRKTLEVYNSLKYRIDISLEELLPEIWGVGYIESRFNLHVNPSKKNARGPMQVLPGTAAKHGLSAYNTEQSIKAGVEEYIEQRTKFKNSDLAAAAYNAGPGAVYKYGGVPQYQETQDYVKQHKALKEKINNNFDFSLLSPS